MLRSVARPLLTAFALGAALTGGAAAETLRVVGEAFGETAEIDIAGLEREAAQAAAQGGLVALARSEAEIASLRAAFETAKEGPVAPSPELFALLARTESFCRWSDGAVGPLGGKLFRLWGVRFPAPGRPAPEVLSAAVDTARCGRIALDGLNSQVRIAIDSELDLLPFELGWAVDRAVTALSEAGVVNGRVRLGAVQRGIGAGPDGKGWRVEIPRLPGSSQPAEGFWLRDRAAAVLLTSDRPVLLGGDPMPRYLDLRSGTARGGTLAVVAVTEFAVDAQAVGWAMHSLGPRGGQMSLGSLRPEPSVLWALGSGEGEPLISVARWSAVPKR